VDGSVDSLNCWDFNKSYKNSGLNIQKADC